LQRVVGVERGVEIGPEPGHEEHHLGSDEQHHPVAVVQLHDAGVVAPVCRLIRDVAPPVEHGVEDAEDAGAEHVRAEVKAGDRHVLHREDEADRHDEGRTGTDQRPRARIDQVVVVLDGVMGVVGVRHSSGLRASSSGFK
jgi:hypothetical protein